MRGFREKAGPALLAIVAASLLALPTASLAKKKNSEPETPPAAQAPAPAQAAPQAAAPGKAGAPAPSGAVAMIGDTPITDTELTEQAANQLQSLKSQEYDIKRRVLEELITKKLIEKEAAARGISVDELNKAEIEAKAPAVTDEEKKTVYEANKARFGDKPEADVMKTMIEPSLKQQRINQRRTEFLSELRAKAQVKVLLEPPRLPVDVGNAAVKGPKDAPVTIVEFSDYQWPFCSRVGPTLKQIEQRYGDKVRIAYREFPLQMHQFAAKASQASQCAKEQGKFWEMNEKLFSNQGKLSVADLKQHAVDLGLKADQFNQCLDSDKYQKDIQKDMDDASKYGVSSTPSFFINGRPFVGAQPLDGFVQVINEELERAGVPIPPPPPAPAPTAAAPAPATPPPGLKAGDPKAKPEVADKGDKKDDKKGDPKGDKP